MGNWIGGEGYAAGAHLALLPLASEQDEDDAASEALSLLTHQRWLEAVAVEAALPDGMVTITIHKTWPSSPTGYALPRFWWEVGHGVCVDESRLRVHTSYRSAQLAYEMAIATLSALGHD